MSLLVVLLLVFSSSSSWLLVSSYAASSFSVVTHLPGFDGPLPFHLETGYVEVDEEEDAHIFYYFNKSERKPEEDPLVVWLTGGPGCSGLSALFFEIGPLKIDVAGYSEGLPSLLYNQYTWTKECNFIFIDSPIGAGFSYSRDAPEYQNGDTKTVQIVYTFITRWCVDHPEFVSNPLYIGGDSASGIHVPAVAHVIANGNREGLEANFNLKGYLVGNGYTDGNYDVGSYVPFVHGMGLIPDDIYKMAERNCGGKYAHPRNAECADSLRLIDDIKEGINYAHILEPKCPSASLKPPYVATDKRRATSELVEEHLQLKIHLPVECRSSGYLLAKTWANNDKVREALHLRTGPTEPYWQRCKADLIYTHDIQSSIQFHRNLTTAGYRALVYSGDHDMVIPHTGTQAWIESLNYSIVSDWRSWIVSGEVAGFTRTYSNNLTFATVKNGGHTAPEYMPKECLAMFQRWISEVPL